MSRVICAGSINMDIVATAERHPAPGETVAGSSLAYFPGGKGANQAVAAARMGAEVVMLGSVGDDASGDQLRAFLRSVGVDTEEVLTVPGPTGTALIVVAKSENVIVVVPGANDTVRGDQLVDRARAGDIVISQFEIPIPAITQCFVSAKGAGARTILNPAPAAQIAPQLMAATDIVIVNEMELGLLVGREPRDGSDAVGLSRQLRHSPEQVVIVTLGANGVSMLANQDALVLGGREVEAVDTTGAGDCFVGAFAAGLARGDDLRTAVETANVAASICVTRAGAGPSMPDWGEVQEAASRTA